MLVTVTAFAWRAGLNRAGRSPEDLDRRNLFPELARSCKTLAKVREKKIPHKKKPFRGIFKFYNPSNLAKFPVYSLIEFVKHMPEIEPSENSNYGWTVMKKQTFFTAVFKLRY